MQPPPELPTCSLPAALCGGIISVGSIEVVKGVMGLLRMLGLVMAMERRGHLLETECPLYFVGAMVERLRDILGISAKKDNISSLSAGPSQDKK